PMCECGIIPVMRRLLRKGVPLSCCIAYMLAGPIINVVVMLSTAVAFSAYDDPNNRQMAGQAGGLAMMGLRMFFGYLVAVGTALVVDPQPRRRGDPPLPAPPALPPRALPAAEDAAGNGDRRSAWQKVANITETALHDFVDITVFLILGGVLAA